MPLILILAESGVEIIPKRLRRHPAVKKNLNRKLYSSQLLDNALHHSAMNRLRDRKKRGRPDIAHLCLLNALGSPLNKSGNLRIFMHTVRDKIFEFNPKVRIAKNFNRFKGLMAKLLVDGDILTPEGPLITHREGSLKDLLESLHPSKTYVLSKKGKLKVDPITIFPTELDQNVFAIVGGFQKTAFSDETLGLSEHLVSISNYPLEAWVATSKIIQLYELAHGIS